MKTTYHATKTGYYGEFGGAYIPEMLYPNISELEKNYKKISSEPSFINEFNYLQKLLIT